MAAHLALDIPEATDPGLASVWLTPSSYPSWTACLAANTDRQRFFCWPGNYTSWGTLTLGPTHAGTPSARRIIMHVDPNIQPWLANEIDDVRISRFSAGTDSGTPTSYWILKGLTERGGTQENAIRMGSQHIIADHCLLEGGTSAYGIRVLLWAQNCTVQYCVIRNWGGSVGDSVGVQMRVPKPEDELAGIPARMENNRVVYCQIYNYVDSVAITHDVDNIPLHNGICNNAIFAYNHFYVEGSHYQSLAENGLDLKGGSDDPARPVWVYRNLINGFRRAAGSDGVGIVTHNWFRNGLIEENIFYDLPMGGRCDSWPVPQPNVARGIEYRNNLFYRMGKFDPLDGAFGFQSALPMTFDGNTFVQSAAVRSNVAIVGGLGPNTMRNNRAIMTSLGLAQTDWEADASNQQVPWYDVGTKYATAYPLTNPTQLEFPYGDPTSAPPLKDCHPRKYTGRPITRLADLA